MRHRKGPDDGRRGLDGRLGNEWVEDGRERFRWVLMARQGSVGGWKAELKSRKGLGGRRESF